MKRHILDIVRGIKILTVTSAIAIAFLVTVIQITNVESWCDAPAVLADEKCATQTTTPTPAP